MTKLGSSYEKAEFLRALKGRFTLLLRSSRVVVLRGEDVGRIRNFDITIAHTGDVYQLDNVWCICGEHESLIDWRRAPKSRCEEFTPDQLRAQYLRCVPGARELRAGVTVGNGTFACGIPPQRAATAQGRALPNGWRVIEGGAK